MSWLAETGAVLAKEARSEWRTRVAAASLGLFVAGALALVGLAFARLSPRPDDRVEINTQIAAALLWLMVLFTAATGLGRAFLVEEERGTAVALRLHGRPTAIWTGKFLANTLQILLLAAVTAPILFQILGIEVRHPFPLALAIGLGCTGVSAVFSFTGAVVAQTSARGGLLAALSFPVLLPQFASGVDATLRAIGYRSTLDADFWATSAGGIVQLASYDAIAITAALLLFEHIWND
ncbi:MAG: heme exporter protein CcmB [Armatimonadota bacterium]